MLDSSKVTSLKSALKHVRNFWNGRIRYMLLNTLTLKWNGFFHHQEHTGFPSWRCTEEKNGSISY